MKDATKETDGESETGRGETKQMKHEGWISGRLTENGGDA